MKDLTGINLLRFIFCLIILLLGKPIDLFSDDTRTFIAYSMRQAQLRIEKAVALGEDFRKNNPQVYFLGGITKPFAIVFDVENGDWLLVGENDPDIGALTLDDWIVALRASLIHSYEDPGVTIDPIGSSDTASIQEVRFFGGIEQTRFGEVCFEADWLMKHIGLGLERPAITGLKTYLDLFEEESRAGLNQYDRISSRFWFYPLINRVNLLGDVILQEKFRLGVFTEVLSAYRGGRKLEDVANLSYDPANNFARSFSDHLDELAAQYDEIATLKGLAHLAGLAKGLAESDRQLDFEFWLQHYPIQKENTPDTVAIVTHRMISGGVRLQALVSRLQKGDATAFKELVLHSRINPESVVSQFSLNIENEIPVGVQIPKSSNLANRSLLWTQASFLHEHGYYSEAIKLWDEIIQAEDSFANAYNERGISRLAMEDIRGAEDDFQQAIERNPNNTSAFFNLGLVRYITGYKKEAIENFDQAIKLNPNFLRAYHYRGLALEQLGELNKAEADFRQYIELDPRYSDLVYHWLWTAIITQNEHLVKELLQVPRDLDVVVDFSNFKVSSGLLAKEIAYYIYPSIRNKSYKSAHSDLDVTISGGGQDSSKLTQQLYYIGDVRVLSKKSITQETGRDLVLDSDITFNDGTTKLIYNHSTRRFSLSVNGKHSFQPLILASSVGHEGIVRLLLDFGANPKGKNFTSQTPLHLAAEKGHVGVVEMLLKAGAKVDVLSRDGKSPLHLAAENGHAEVIGVLLNSGADIDGQTKDGATALYLASAAGEKLSATKLIQAGADINLPNNAGRTPVMVVTLHRYPDILSTLASGGADLNQQDNKGNTALIHAAEIGAKMEAMELIRLGAKHRIRNHLDRNARQVAKKMDNRQVYRLLKYLKPVYFTFFKGGVNLSSFSNPENSYTPGLDMGFSLQFKLGNRLRLQNDLLFTLNGSDINNDFIYNSQFGSTGDYYYEMLQVDAIPMVRYDLGNLYGRRPYIFGGVGYRYLLSAEIRSWSEGRSVANITNSSKKNLAVMKVGLGYGTPFFYMELFYQQSLSTPINDVADQLHSFGVCWGFGL